MGGKNDFSGRSATKEQLRVAQFTQEPHDEDRQRIQKLIKEIIETTRCTASQAEIALFDADNNVEVAVNVLLESKNPDTWSHQKTRKEKKKNDSEDSAGKKSIRNGQPRKGPRQPFQNGNGQQPDEHRKPRDVDGHYKHTEKGDRPFRKQPTGDRPQAPRAQPERKDDAEDWKSGPRVFQRTEVFIEEKTVQTVTEVTPPSVESAKPACAAGPMSFAAVVARQPKREIPKPVQPVVEEPKPYASNSTCISFFSVPEPEVTEETSHEIESSEAPEVQQSVSSETIPSPPKPAPPLSYSGQIDGVDQSLTDQLKNDLGLGTPSFNSSLHSSTSASKTDFAHSSHRDAVIEWATEPAPSTDLTFDFSYGLGQPVSSVREPPFVEPRISEPVVNHLSPVKPAPQTVPTIQPQVPPPQPSQSHPVQQPHIHQQHPQQPPQAHPQNQHQQPQQPQQQQQVPQTQHQPQTHQAPHQAQQQQQQHMFPAKMPYNLPYLYNAVPGIPHDSYSHFMQYQFGMGGLDMNAFNMLPQMTVTSAGPMPGQNHHQQTQHHQTQPQTGHQRSDHYADVSKYNSMNTVSGGQNNGSANQSQPSSLNQQQQRQQIIDNGSQGLNSAVGPPPGFSAPVQPPFVQPTAINGLSSLFPQFSVPFNPGAQFPFMNMPQKMPPQPVYQTQNVDEQDVRLSQQQKNYGQPDKFGSTNGNKDRSGPAGQHQMGNYAPQSYNSVGGGQLLGNKKNYSSHQAWN